MTHHYFEPQKFHRCFETSASALALQSGDRVSTSLLDAHGHDRQGKKWVEHSNPLVGPFFIQGSRPGDTLAVHFERIDPNNTHGWSYLLPLPGTVEPASMIYPPARPMIHWEMDLATHTVQPVGKDPDLADLVLPLSPMLGCIGVAPSMNQAITSYSSGNFGGNMDCPLFTAGSTIYLPVFVEGGLLYIGDGHARQCDGEITGGAIEISCDVEFSVEIIQYKNLHWPRGENGSHRFTLGCSRPVEHCLQIATTEMHQWLVQDWPMPDSSAWALMSQTIEYQLCNTVSPNFTATCKLSKNYLP